MSDSSLQHYSDKRVEHGWAVEVAGDPVTTVGRVWTADLRSPHRCRCSQRCAHDATQEDLLCDWCRDHCAAPLEGEREQ